MNTHRHNSRLLGTVAAVVACSLAVAACGSSGSATTSTTSGAAPGSTGASTGKTVKVTLANFSVTVAGGNHLAPGTYTFMATNTSGGTGHNLTISGPGVANQATPTFTSGTKPLTVTLKHGTYTFFCSIHKARGMTTTVSVGSGSSGGATTTSGGGSSSSGGGWG